MPERKIHLIHLTDGNVRTCVDDGCAADGRPNIRRSQLLRILGKRIVERDEHGDPLVGKHGRVVSWPMVRLHAPPQPLHYNMADAKQAECAQHDTFDQTRLSGENGDWILASDEWLEASTRFREKRSERQTEVDAIELAKLQQNVGVGLQQLMDAVREKAPSLPRRRAPSGEAATTG